MKNGLIICILVAIMTACTTSPESTVEAGDKGFSFVFMTDIHLKPEMGAPEGFQMAIDSVNALKPDFVITGGDLVDDALFSTHERADTLYRLYKEMAKGFDMPVYNTMGNHEIYGYNANPPADPEHPEYGEKMFENRIGKRYYSFDHKGWHFMILDGIEKGEGNWGAYVGKVDEEQIQWIRDDLEKLKPETPIVIVTHIPLVSIMPQITKGPLFADNQSSLVTNQQEVLAPFRMMNLKLVLQGHLHALEDNNLMGRTHFLTGGAVCGRWWRTPDDSEFQEGFVKIDIKGNDFSWEYVDYGWETGIVSQ
ncbi:MAG: metallophosphoesterase [Bacteroidota bacterium]